MMMKLTAWLKRDKKRENWELMGQRASSDHCCYSFTHQLNTIVNSAAPLHNICLLPQYDPSHIIQWFTT